MSKKEFEPDSFGLYMDVDDTSAQDIVARHMEIYNEELALGMSQEDITTANQQHKKTFDVPQIIEFRKRSPEAETEFQRVRASIRISVPVHAGFTMVPFADQAMHYLAQEYDQGLAHYTVRKEEVEKTTKEWLKKNNLPNSESVVICENPKDKIIKIIVDAKSKNKKPILFDDSISDLVKACEELANDAKFMNEFGEVFEHLVIVGFGFDNVDQFIKRGDEIGVSIMHLQSWQVLSFLWKKNE